MRKDTQRAIAKALSAGPRTVKQICATTGLSYNTVQRGLNDMGAESNGYFPAEWKFESASLDEFVDNAMSNNKSVAKTDNVMSVDYSEFELYKFNEQHERLGNFLRKLEIKPTDNPKDIARELATGAASLASIAFRLNEAADDPAWFTTLGGNISSLSQK